MKGFQFLIFSHREWFKLRCPYSLPLGKLTRYVRNMVGTEYEFTIDGLVVREKIPAGFVSDVSPADVPEIEEYR